MINVHRNPDFKQTVRKSVFPEACARLILGRNLVLPWVDGLGNIKQENRRARTKICPTRWSIQIGIRCNPTTDGNRFARDSKTDSGITKRVVITI